MSKIKNQIIVEQIADDDAYVDNLLYVESTKTFYLYNGQYYKIMEDEEMERILYQHIKSRYPDHNITSALINDILQQLRWECKGRIKDINTPYIALRDKVLDTTDFTFYDHDKKRVAINFIDFEAKNLAEATCPRWLQFLDEVLVDNNLKPDRQLQVLMQEIFGYYLTNELHNHEMFFFVGEGSNGKSVLLRVLMDMIGQENCTAKSIESLTTDKFATAGLVGKKANICAEEESKYLRSDKFKALVSGDPIEAQRKFKDPIMFVPKVKYIFATNEMPTFEGINKGLKRRINIVPFHRSFSKNEMDKQLTTKLQAELDGILAWAIEGGKRLMKNNWRFSEAKALNVTMHEFVKGISSALAYFMDECEISTNELVAKQLTYQKYKDWCIDMGHKPKSQAKFRNEIKAHNPDLQEKLIKRDGKSVRVWNVVDKVHTDDELDISFEDNEDFIDLSSLLDTPPFN